MLKGVSAKTPDWRVLNKIRLFCTSLALTAVMAAVCGTNASAREECAAERIISENGAVTISESGLKKNEEIFLWIFSGNADWKTVSTDKTLLDSAVYADSAVSTADGRDWVCRFNFVLSNQGKYTALINGKKRLLVYADKTSAESAAASLKGLNRNDAVNFIDTNKDSLTVSTELFQNGNDAAAVMVYDWLTVNRTATASEIGIAIDKAYLISAINESRILNIGDYLYSSGIAGNYNYKSSYNSDIVEAVKGASGISDFDSRLKKAFEKLNGTGSAVKPPVTGGGGNGGGGGYVSKTNKNADGAIISDMSNYTPEQKKDNNGTVYFSDMTGFEWAREAVDYLYLRGVVSGRTEQKYCPGELVLREEFAKLLIQITKLNVVSDDMVFSDVSKDAWCYEYVNRAYKAGIIHGISDDIFGIGKCITRQDMAVMVYNALNVCGINPPAGDIPSFADEEDVSEYAGAAVDALVQLKLISGYDDGTFKPLATATRAEAAQIAYRTLILLSK